MRLENLPFRLESGIVRTWYRVTGTRPSSDPFVSGDSFRALADQHREAKLAINHARLKAGDVIFVQGSLLEKFIERDLPRISTPFVLITHNSDRNIDKKFRELAGHHLVLRWFAQNAVFRHPKITAIPIGLENRNLYWNGIVEDFRRLAQRRVEKSPRILAAFSLQTCMAERAKAKMALQGLDFVDELERMNSRKYRKILNDYCFVASPPGNGIDCHRTWEALYLGVVPIVRKSAFYSSFPGLPVLKVDDWREIRSWNRRFLAESYEKLSEAIETTPYIWFSYWEERIRKARCSVSQPSTRKATECNVFHDSVMDF